jgi:hypothetical protein
MKKHILLFIFLSSFHILYSQIFKREVILKNNIWEAKVSVMDIIKNEKTLSCIYYFNDSGLVEKVININIDRDSLGNEIVDTSFVFTYKYDSLNREIKETTYHKNKIDVYETEYLSPNLIQRKGIDENGKIYIYKKIYRKRNNLTIYKSYINGHLIYRNRKREYSTKIITKEVKSLTYWKKRGWGWYNPRKSKVIITLDSSKRQVSQISHYHRFFFLTKQSSSNNTYNGELVEKISGLFKDKNSYCYTYEYKKGIPLIEK